MAFFNGGAVGSSVLCTVHASTIYSNQLPFNTEESSDGIRIGV
jgi:hypothetical protein